MLQSRLTRGTTRRETIGTQLDPPTAHEERTELDIG